MKRRSPVWKISKEEFEKIVKNSNTISAIWRHFGLTNAGSSRTVHQRIKEDSIDISHIRLGKNSNLGKKGPNKKTPLEEILIENSSYSRGWLKKRLIQEKLLDEKCQKCGLEPFWNGEPLVLVLDHINGINNDNRLENLRLLCPNCNSQTPTFTGRKNAKNLPPQIKLPRHIQFRNNCSRCGKIISRKATFCKRCSAFEMNFKNRKAERPTKEQLESMIRSTSFLAVAKTFGVSDNAIRKWCKHYDLPYKKAELQAQES